jgi:phosphoglycolate phosphatase
METMNTSPDPSPRIKAVVFDFDYTLADFTPGVIECMNYALEHMGLPTADDDAIQKMIGVPLEETFRELAGDRDDISFDEFRRLFVERSDRVMMRSLRFFDPVPQVVRSLRARGLALAILSTKHRYRIQDVLLRERLLDAFAVVVGGDDVATHKPDPAGLQLAVTKLHRLPSEVVYVGDSTVDAETARRAAVPFVAVLSGPTRREDFAIYSRLTIIDDLAQLPRLVLGPSA